MIIKIYYTRDINWKSFAKGGVCRTDKTRTLSCWDLLKRQTVEPCLSLELAELNSGVSALIISAKHGLIIAGGKDGSLSFINEKFEVLSVQKFPSLGKLLHFKVKLVFGDWRKYYFQ